MTIGPAEEKDLEECAELGRIPEFELPSGGFLEAEYLKIYLDPDFFIVAEEGNKIIGYALGEKLKGPLGLLSFLMVSKKQRGKGVGTKLLKDFEKRVKKRGVKWILLYGPYFNKKTLAQSSIEAGQLIALLHLLEQKKITERVAQKLMEELAVEHFDVNTRVEEKGLGSVSDEGLIAKCCEEAIKENERAATEFKAGSEKSLNFLVGQVMRKTKGKASPDLIKKLLLEKLKN